MDKSLFETEEGHLNLNVVLEEIQFLYKTYGITEDKLLSKEAIVRKHQILDFVNQIHKLYHKYNRDQIIETEQPKITEESKLYDRVQMLKREYIDYLKKI